MKKLFAVGTNNPNPKTWKLWEEIRLYIADSYDEAIKMDGRFHKKVAVEVDMSKSCFVLGMHDFPDD